MSLPNPSPSGLREPCGRLEEPRGEEGMEDKKKTRPLNQQDGYTDELKEMEAVCTGSTPGGISELTGDVNTRSHP